MGIIRDLGQNDKEYFKSQVPLSQGENPAVKPESKAKIAPEIERMLFCAISRNDLESIRYLLNTEGLHFDDISLEKYKKLFEKGSLQNAYCIEDTAQTILHIGKRGVMLSQDISECFKGEEFDELISAQVSLINGKIPQSVWERYLNDQKTRKFLSRLHECSLEETVTFELLERVLGQQELKRI